MDPFNANKTPIARPIANNMTPQGDPVHGHKKRMLQSLVHHALNGVNQGGRTVHDIAHSVKTAIGAYKNYSKEWDGLHGVDPKADGNGGPGMMPQQPMQQPARPQTPNLQMPQNRTPTPPIQQQMAQPPAPVSVQPPIARPMPAFMGGGHPAGF